MSGAADNLCTSFLLLRPPEGKGSPVILSLLSSALKADVEASEKLQRNTSATIQDVAEGTRSKFQASAAPRIQVEEYIERLFKYTKCSPACLVMAFVYIRRIAAMDSLMQPSSLSVHRLLIAGTVVASKFTDDKYFTNLYYAQVGGVSLNELNCLEIELLKKLEYKAHVSVEEMSCCLQYIQNAAAEGASWVAAQRLKRDGVCSFNIPGSEESQQVHEHQSGGTQGAANAACSKLTTGGQVDCRAQNWSTESCTLDSRDADSPCTPCLAPHQGLAVLCPAQWIQSRASMAMDGCKRGHGPTAHSEQVAVEAA